MDGYQSFRVTIGGNHLIMHNGQTADPLNKFAKAMKQISGTRKKTDTDHARLADLEYRAGLYLNEEGQVNLPSRVLEACIVEGAKVSREGKTALASVFVDTDGILDYEGGPLTADELVESPSHRLAVPVRVSTSRIVRTRPRFRNWAATFDVSVNTDMANAERLQDWITAAGSHKGIGDWRPRNGRFDLRGFEQI